MTSLPQEIHNIICAINTWQTQRIQLAVRIAHDAFEHMTSSDITNIQSLLEELDRRLIEEISPEINARSDSDSAATDIFEPNDGDVADGGVEPMSNTPTSTSSPPIPGRCIRQLSHTWSMDDVDGQALAIKQKSVATYNCYKDTNNGVMACHDNQLVYVDWVLRPETQGNVNKIRVVSVEGDDQEQHPFRSVAFPSDLENMRVVDIDYASFMSKYIFAVISRQPMLERRSFLYCFDSEDDSFERWVSLTDTKDGLIARFCCCAGKPIIYLIVNVFGEARLLTMDSDGTVRDRKAVHDLPLGVENGRLVDVACTSRNDRLAIAYNTSVSGTERARISICLMDPSNWVRMASLNLGSADALYTVPRLTWLNKLAMFVLVNHENDQLLTFNIEGKLLGWRSFFHFVEEYEEPYLRPVNVCAADSTEWIAVRYTRFINIHHIIP